MTHSASCSAPEAQFSAYRVEPPRPSDAIAISLRDALAREAGLPDDMIALLRRLNGYEVPTSH